MMAIVPIATNDHPWDRNVLTVPHSFNVPATNGATAAH
jgi:hypothetical protein